MDVRCEKCQTEYELDEARLKPGGVTVKCTHCGHMFKIRKRTVTNVGAPPVTTPPPMRDAADEARTRPASSRQSPLRTPPVRDSGPDLGRPGSVAGAGDDAPTSVERQWLLRLENGEQRSCREIGTLQQWIISGIITRESLISRNGKTWKRLGDVPDLGQYFEIADDARETRERVRPTPVASIKDIPGTLTGYGGAPQAAGGTILPDDVEGPTSRKPPGRPPVYGEPHGNGRGHGHD